MSRIIRKMVILLAAILIAVSTGAMATMEPVPESMQEAAVPEMIAFVRPCESDGQQLFGVLFVPDTQKPVPLIIYEHGLGGNYEEAVGLAEYVVSQGMAFYAFDFHAGAHTQSGDDDSMDMSLMTEAKDLAAVIEQAEQWQEIDPESIALIGHSQGGAVAAITAARYPDEVDGLILLAPAFMLPEYTRQFYASKEDIDESVYFMGTKVGRTYFESLWDYDIYAEIGAYHKPVLIIHGDMDSTVPIAYSQKALSVYENAELIVLSGEGHHAFWSAGEETISYISAYLKEIGFDGGITQ